MVLPSAPQFDSASQSAFTPQFGLNGASTPEDLSRPLYGASFSQAVKRFFKKYATFSGRASRSEYWWAALFTFIVQMIPVIIGLVGLIPGVIWMEQNPNVTSLGFDSAGEEVLIETAPGIIAAPTGVIFLIGAALGLIAWLAVIVPQIAVLWRRLHDANFAGPFALLSFIPSVGGLIVLVLALLPSKPEGQRFDVPSQPR